MSKKSKKFKAATVDELPVAGNRVMGDPRTITGDAFANGPARLGVGNRGNNLLSGGTFDFTPISRDRQLLENAYRGSWIVRQAIDVIPEDMTREGIEIQSDMPPDDIDKFYASFSRKGIWHELKSGLSWARLYGGCVVLMQIDGQKLETPLRTQTISKGQFRGLRALDRWMIQPSLSANELITDPGPSQGLPMFYDVVVEAGGMPKGRIHHSRVIRFDGAELPFFQRQMENLWGLSILEPLWDRLISFDSTSMGAAQLVFKAHLRTMTVEGLQQMASVGGPAYEGLRRRLDWMAQYQSSEGMTIIDAREKLETTSYTFSGLDSVLIQFAQQLSGALGIPLVRLFGQSPAGLNSTGESDLRNFYDKIKELQENDLREGIDTILKCEHQSLFGRPPENDFAFEFNTLWQVTEKEKAEIAAQTTTAIVDAFSAGIVDKPIAMRELNQSSKITGVWSNITDADIEQAELEPPPVPGMPPGAPGAGDPMGGGGGPPGMPPGGGGPPAGPNPELEALHGKLKGADLSGKKPSGPLTLKSHHELDLLHHQVKGSDLNAPKGLNKGELEDLHNKLRGKALTGDGQSKGTHFGGQRQTQMEIVAAAQMIPKEAVKEAMEAGLTYEAASELYGWHQPRQTTLDEGFNPAEPRIEKGNPGGGEWTKGGNPSEGASQRPLNPKVIDVGGDEWNKKTAHRLESEYVKALPDLEQLAKEIVGTETPVEEDEDEENDDPVPEEWEMLTDDQQEQTKQAWKKGTYDEFLQSETDNWYSEQAQNEANMVTADEFNDENDDWSMDAINEYYAERKENGETEIPFDPGDLRKALKLEDSSKYDDHEHYDLEIDDGVFHYFPPKGYNENQLTIPGVEEQTPGDFLTDEMRAGLIEHMEKAFEKEAEDRKDKLDAPDYLSDSVDEFQDEFWSGKSDDEKFEDAKAYNIFDPDDYESGGDLSEQSVEIVEPKKFDPLGSGDAKHYKQTQAFIRKMSIDRAAELIQQRGIKDDVQIGAIRSIDNELWTSWKNSSTSDRGKVLQVASADELGGRLREFKTDYHSLDRKETIAYANETFKSIGGYEGVKAYLRAKWETSQYMLDKAGIHTLQLYRTIRRDDLFKSPNTSEWTISSPEWQIGHLPEWETGQATPYYLKKVTEGYDWPATTKYSSKEAAEIVLSKMDNSYKLINVKTGEIKKGYKNYHEAVMARVDLDKPPAPGKDDPTYTEKVEGSKGYEIKEGNIAAPKFDKLPNLTVARNGLASTSTDVHVCNGWDGENRVVLRAEVPRTAIVSVPAYGINVQGEHETVISGTAWKGWDAWFKRAPTFEQVPCCK